MRMGRSFPIKAQPESASHFRTGFRDAVSSCIAIGKPHPALSVDSGMNFPLGRRRESVSHFEIELWDAVSGWTAIGKSHPAFELNSGMRFPLWRLRDSMSRSESVFRDALSASVPIGKLCPILGSDSGMCFPVGRPWGKCVPFRRRSPPHAPSSANIESSANRLGKQKTGWNGNSNRLYLQATVEQTTTARPRGKSDG